MKKIISFSLIIMLCFAAMLLLTSCGGNTDYEKANALFAEGKYEDALAIYESLGDYEDSAGRAIIAAGMKDMGKGKYKDVLKEALRAGIYVNISYDVDGGKLENQKGDKTDYSYTKATEFRDVKEAEKDGHELVKWDVVSAAFDENGALNLSLKANWKSEVYNVKYTLNGGTLSNGVTSYSFADGATLVAPTRLGYSFIGWTTAENDTPIVDLTIPEGSRGDLLFVANWEAKVYTITLNANGGTAESASFEVGYGDYYELPAAKKDGFRFGGWYLGETKCEEAGSWNTDESITLVAKWLPRYTISILGDSISSYFGVSNNASTNASLATNPAYYNTDMDKSDLDSVNDTYWKLAADALNLEICVPNGCAASRVTDTIPDAEGYENVVTGLARANSLHRADGTNPDIIFVLLGTNDIGGGISVGEFKTAYRTLLETIKQNYPNAEIYVGTLIPQNRDVTPENNDAYNAAIKDVARILEITVVDIATDSGITWNNYTEQTADNLHPNKSGMARIAQCLIDVIGADFPAE